MHENNALVTKVRQLCSKQQELLSMITKFQDEALQANEQDVSAETRVELLVKESHGIFLNGPRPLETTQEII